MKKVHISHTSLKVVKVLTDDTCNTHGIGQVGREYETLIGSSQGGMSCNNTGLFEMIVGVLTTCHTQYT